LKQAVSKETAFFASLMPLLTFSFEFTPGFNWSVAGFPGGVMEFGLHGNDKDSIESLQNQSALHVQVTVAVAHEELRRLMQQRAEIIKRIGTIKQTIAGLCNLIGDHELGNDLRELVNCKAGVRRSGLTQLCRTVLMEASCPVNAREVSEQIQRQTNSGLPSHKNLVASVITVLNRLVQYGEARTVLRENGRRAWLWVSDAGDRKPDPVNRSETLVSQP
jgi:hypothetical protein